MLHVFPNQSGEYRFNYGHGILVDNAFHNNNNNIPFTNQVKIKRFKCCWGLTK